eukprot:343644-Rhodomonas_salina.1
MAVQEPWGVHAALCSMVRRSKVTAACRVVCYSRPSLKGSLPRVDFPKSQWLLGRWGRPCWRGGSLSKVLHGMVGRTTVVE